MTVNTTPVETNYTGDASTTVFALTFAFAANAHVKVYLGGVLQGSGYSITGAGNPSGGTLTFSAAPGSGVAIKARRVTPLTQEIDVVNNATVFASSLETGLDYALMRQQEEAFDRIALGVTFAIDAAAVDADAAAAAASAASALAAKIAAETAETNAETAETNAETAKTLAEAARDAAQATDVGALTAIITPSSGNLLVKYAGTEWARFDNKRLLLGTATGDSRLVIETAAAELIRGFDIYHHADQTAPSNQYVCFGIHNYTDGPSAIIDTVGTQQGLVLRQARNPAARPDKASTYVGDGIFLDFQRSRVSGSGNLGTGNDRLLMVDQQGCLVGYGPNAVDWTGGSSDAPIQLGTYTGFQTRKLYLGYDYANNKGIIGSIDTGGGVFTNLTLQAASVTMAAACAIATTATVGGNLGVGMTSGVLARVHSTVADGSYALGLSGTTKGIRVESNSTCMTLRGVDNTLGGSFQPLGLGGSELIFSTNGSTERGRWESGGTLRPTGNNTQDLGASGTRWANTYSANVRPGAGAVIWTSGTGTPEGVVTAPVGSLFTRTDGGAATTLYVKETGAGNTGWVGK
jgi:hypothetical protein